MAGFCVYIFFKRCKNTMLNCVFTAKLIKNISFMKKQIHSKKNLAAKFSAFKIVINLSDHHIF